jgi:hypothetical protein
VRRRKAACSYPSAARVEVERIAEMKGWWGFASRRPIWPGVRDEFVYLLTYLEGRDGKAKKIHL